MKKRRKIHLLLAALAAFAGAVVLPDNLTQSPTVVHAEETTDQVVVHHILKKKNGDFKEFGKWYYQVAKDQDFTTPAQEYPNYSYSGYVNPSELEYLNTEAGYARKVQGQPVAKAGQLYALDPYHEPSKLSREIYVYYDETVRDPKLDADWHREVSIEYVGRKTNGEFVDLGRDKHEVSKDYQVFTAPILTYPGYSYSGYIRPDHADRVPSFFQNQEELYNERISSQPMITPRDAYQTSNFIVVYYDEGAARPAPKTSPDAYTIPLKVRYIGKKTTGEFVELGWENPAVYEDQDYSPSVKTRPLHQPLNRQSLKSRLQPQPHLLNQAHSRQTS